MLHQVLQTYRFLAVVGVGVLVGFYINALNAGMYDELNEQDCYIDKVKGAYMASHDFVRAENDKSKYQSHTLMCKNCGVRSDSGLMWSEALHDIPCSNPATKP